jgi:hypothetical protein
MRYADSRPRRWAVAAFLAAALTLMFLVPACHAPPPGGAGGSGTGTGVNVSAFPSQDACHVTDNFMPHGNCGPFRQIFAENFSVGSVPLGGFSDCNHNTASPAAYCGGLTGHWRRDWWAYPSGWRDTAKSGADGNRGAPFGGTYEPQDTVWVSGGEMHIRMYRPAAGGDNHVAAVAPRACGNMWYGKYSERFLVSRLAAGFKSAHLFYQRGQFEIDYPDNDWGATISAYTHPGEANFSTAARWTDWHTTSIEWTPGTLKFFLDGALIGATTRSVPDIPMSWVLQNESSINGPYAAPGGVAQMDITWVTCYKFGG